MLETMQIGPVDLTEETLPGNRVFRQIRAKRPSGLLSDEAQTPDLRFCGCGKCALI